MHLQIDNLKIDEVISDITENKIELEECEDYDPGSHDPDVQGFGNGVYSVRMKLTCNLPQLVPNVRKKSLT